MEASLDKVVRLSRQGLGSGALKGGKLRLGTPYRSSWGSVHVGDVVELGSELWRVIPVSSYPQGRGGAVSLAAPPVPPPAQAAAPGDALGAPPPVRTATLHMQDVRHPASYDRLTLPVSYVVSVVPVL